ncbi:RidA family protein [Sphingomonas sp. S6]|jgi:2-iminobutanoate/2-iminopropanoate deaminase|uniref:RidA family protein n=1 Tax=Sphingomonas sp. S6 TaxID=3368600 RepID=UPI000FBB95FD|nr:RidA family protein [uncultured Sphingomonas sp.]RTL23457.1 MAG: endonuclease [Sphingomonadaceae bacterium]
MRLAPLGYAAIGLAALTAQANAQSVVKHPNSTPGLILQSVTVKSGASTLYLSGQLAAPLEPAKNVPTAELTIADFGDTKTQTASILNKIKGILAEHGYTMADVVKLTVFVAGDPKLGGKMDFAGMNEGFKQFFGTADNPGTVARSTVQVAALAGPAFLVEIEATAAK